jgi:hypothetical protein
MSCERFSRGVDDFEKKCALDQSSAEEAMRSVMAGTACKLEKIAVMAANPKAHPRTCPPLHAWDHQDHAGFEKLVLRPSGPTS